MRRARVPETARFPPPLVAPLFVNRTDDGPANTLALGGADHSLQLERFHSGMVPWVSRKLFFFFPKCHPFTRPPALLEK